MKFLIDLWPTSPIASLINFKLLGLIPLMIALSRLVLKKCFTLEKTFSIGFKSGE